MARELRPGVVRTDMIRVEARVQAAAVALARFQGDAMVERAQALVSQQSHAYGTPTPASRGGPPAMISGTLHDAVAASAPRPTAAGVWEVRVGLLAGRRPWYGKTEAHLYGMYLDRGLYPWLTPAFRATARSGGAGTARRIKGWISAA